LEAVTPSLPADFSRRAKSGRSVVDWAPVSTTGVAYNIGEAGIVTGVLLR
jgi:hypothetical protein